MSVVRSLSSNPRWVAANSLICDTIVGYFDRTDDHRQIREGVINRYGLGIKVQTDPAKNRIETYTREGFAERVYAGTIEAISIGYGHLITTALAQLFGDASQFRLVSDNEADTSRQQELLDSMRSMGGFDTAMGRGDARSIECGSSFVLIEWVDGHTRYRAYDPSRLQACFDSLVVDEGSARSVDTSQLEDAVCVIVRTGTVDGIEHHYLAIFGESDAWPKGRYCTYTTSGDGRSVPSPGTAGCVDYYAGTELANPLTLYAQAHPDMTCPEYPIVILYGTTVSDELLPVSKSLWQESIDADVAASHLRSTSQDAARGTLALLRTSEALGQPVPRSLHGIVDLAPGQSIEHISHDSGSSVDGWTVLKNELVQLAQAWGVPDYMVTSEDHTVEAASGVALEVRTRPLRRAIDQRVAGNSASVRTLWEIERALVWLFGDGSAGDMAAWDACTQVWTHAGIELPSNPVEDAARVKTLMDMGIYDLIAAIREIYHYASDEEAIAEYERMSARAKIYPKLQEDNNEQAPESDMDI